MSKAEELAKAKGCKPRQSNAKKSGPKKIWNCKLSELRLRIAEVRLLRQTGGRNLEQKGGRHAMMPTTTRNDAAIREVNRLLLSGEVHLLRVEQRRGQPLSEAARRLASWPWGNEPTLWVQGEDEE